MEVPRVGVESELQLPAYTTATATWDLSHVCNLHHSSWPCWFLNPLREARDGTRNLMVPSRDSFPLGHSRNSASVLFCNNKGSRPIMEAQEVGPDL